MTKREVFAAMRQKLAKRKNWLQCYSAMGNGRHVAIEDPTADTFCLVGAFWRVLWEDGKAERVNGSWVLTNFSREVYNYLTWACGVTSPMGFNDRCTTTHDDILFVLTKAESLCPAEPPAKPPCPVP